LTAHRTLALCATLAQRPDVALLALAHRLAVVTFYDGDYAARNEVQIDLRRTNLDQYGEDVSGSKAHRAMAELAEGWRARLPSDSATLFDWLAQQPQADVLSLCAYCVATTLNGVSADESGGLDALGNAAGLDMRQWWYPTADGYLKSVPKARIFEALAEAGASPSGALEKLKKGDLALLAEQRLAGTGWLPTVLRGAAA
jgi:ParB family chromosome partitioning protein